MDQKPEQPPPRERLSCAGVLYWLFAIALEAAYIGLIIRDQSEPSVWLPIVVVIVWPFVAVLIYHFLSRSSFDDVRDFGAYN